MHLNLIQIIFLIFYFKVNFIFSSVILDRNKLSRSDNQNLTNNQLYNLSNTTSLSNVSFSNNSFLVNSSSNYPSTNSSDNKSFSSLSTNLTIELKNDDSLSANSQHQLKSTDTITVQEKKSDRNLVKEVDNQTTSADDKPLANSIIDEELLNEFKQANNSKNLEIITSFEEKIDNDKMNETLMLSQDDDDVYNLSVDSETQDCIFVRSVDGVYTFYSNRNHTDVCGLYSIAEPNQLIEYEFEKFNINCGDYNEAYPKNNQSLLTIVDGWELNGQFFPGLQDHLLKKTARYKEICINNTQTDQAYVKTVYRVSQNVGLLQFRILNPYEGFKVRVRFIENPKPCNVVFRLPTGLYTLKNYGQNINCSVSILFPESIRIISNTFVNRPLMIERELTLDKKGHIIKPSDYYDYQLNKTDSTEQSTPNESTKDEDSCLNKMESDYIEVKGGGGLDTGLMLTADKLCLDKEPLKKKQIDVDCGNTAVRLVSSGLYDNSITIAFDLLDPTESSAKLLKCPERSKG